MAAVLDIVSRYWLPTLILYGLAWVGFAVFDFRANGEVFRAYTAIERSVDTNSTNMPPLLPNGVTDYRISSTKVISKNGPFISEYEDCTVFDVNNWSCTFSDNSGGFGVRQGNYYSSTNVEKFPHLADLPKDVTMSRFGYILLGCRLDGISNILLCAIRPFVL